jgi:predicted AAA+ superfamily ATPase
MEGYRNSTMYIKRHLETTIEKLNSCFKVLLVTGPRQVGKTTLLRRLAAVDRTYVTMDDISVRSLAMTEPALFLQRYKPPLLIDEIQMAQSYFLISKCMWMNRVKMVISG